MKRNIIIVVVILAVLAIVYLLLGRTPEPRLPSVAPAVSEELTVSDEVPVIEQELQATEIENLDKELADIESEINAALEE